MRTVDRNRWRRAVLSGRARRHPSAGQWLAAGTFRNWRGVTAGLVCAWFNVPLVIMIGAIGGILGAVAGAVSGTAFSDGVMQRLDVFVTWIFPLPLENGVADLLPTTAAQLGGIIGAAWGGANGALELGWLAFYWPWQALYGDDPSWPVAVAAGQVVTAVIVGAGYTVFFITTERWRLRLWGARRLSRREANWLMPIVEEVAQRMQLRGIPHVMMSDSREANAYAVTRHIVIQKGLIEQFAYDTDKVAGVIAHELAHWDHGDTVAKVFAKGVSLPLYLANEFAVKVLNSEASRIRPLQWVMRLLLWGVTVTVRRLVEPANAAHERRCELRADAAAAAAGFGEGIREGLIQLGASFESGRDGWDQVMIASHPPTELRIERLETAGRTYDLAPTSVPAKSATSGTTSTNVDKEWLR